MPDILDIIVMITILFIPPLILGLFLQYGRSDPRL